MMQYMLFGEAGATRVRPFKTQLLKWIGNKQRFAHEIADFRSGDRAIAAGKNEPAAATLSRAARPEHGRGRRGGDRGV